MTADDSLEDRRRVRRLGGERLTGDVVRSSPEYEKVYQYHILHPKGVRKFHRSLFTHRGQ